MFKSRSIRDSQGREVQPVIAVIVESVKDSSDVIVYSIQKRASTAFTVNKVLSFEDGYFTHRNSIGYEGEYKKQDIIHKLLIAHMREKSVGLQVICDSTDDVYNQVEQDMRNFILAIGIDQ